MSGAGSEFVSGVTRRCMGLGLMSAALVPANARRLRSRQLSVRDRGARGDGVAVDTQPIQATIDDLARFGGGTMVVPAGLYICGALFLKPGVHMHLERGAVLRCSTDMTNFPPMCTRIEGHFEPAFTPALINADGCDGLRITGAGVLDGAGRPIWDRFWELQRKAPDPANFPNLSIPRARLALIQNSQGVTIDGVTFKDSQFWNLHLYRCRNVVVRNSRFLVPDDYQQAPSTDGIDVDSCQDVVIDSCYFSVTDDCVAAKGSKGPQADKDKDSPPVERLTIRNCHFRRGHHALACGSEATTVRDVLVEHCRVTGDMVLARLKLRSDTPQHYERIIFRDIDLDCAGGTVLGIEPWRQYTNLGDASPPNSIVHEVRFEKLRGRFGAFGRIAPNPGQTLISDILLRDIDLSLDDGVLHHGGVAGLRFSDVTVNGKQVHLQGSS